MDEYEREDWKPVRRSPQVLKGGGVGRGKEEEEDSCWVFQSRFEDVRRGFTGTILNLRALLDFIMDLVSIL